MVRDLSRLAEEGGGGVGGVSVRESHPYAERRYHQKW